MSRRRAIFDSLNALDFNKPYTMACGLVKLMLDHEITAGDIHTMTQRSSPSWWYERSQLANLDPQIGEAVDNKTLRLVSASALAKFPVNVQLELFDKAMNLPPDQFIPVANTRLIQMRKGRQIAKRELRTEQPQVVWFVRVADMSLTYEELGQGTYLIHADNPLAKHTDPVELAQAYEIQAAHSGDAIHKVIGVRRAE